MVNSCTVEIEEFDGSEGQPKKHVLMPGVIEPGKSPADLVVLDPFRFFVSARFRLGVFTNRLAIVDAGRRE